MEYKLYRRQTESKKGLGETGGKPDMGYTGQVK